MSADEWVQTSLHEGVLTVRLNRPAKRNALSQSMIRTARAAVESADRSRDCRVICIRGAGPDFCSGADLGELLASRSRTLAENEAEAMELGELLLALRHAHQPTVAVVQGRCLAGGAGLASSCDIVLAVQGSTFGYPEVSRGFVPAMVMAFLVRLVGERRAMELVLTGRVLTAHEAVDAGLATRVIDAEDWDDAAQRLLQQLVRLPVSAVSLTKQLFRESAHLSIREGVALGARVNAAARATPEFNQLVEEFLAK